MPHAEEWLYWGNACDYTLQLESSWKKWWGVWTSFNICEKCQLNRAPEHYRHALLGHNLGPTCETDTIIVPYPCDKQNFELLIIFSEQTWNLNETSNHCSNNADKELELILGKHTVPLLIWTTVKLKLALVLSFEKKGTEAVTVAVPFQIVHFCT